MIVGSRIPRWTAFKQDLSAKHTKTCSSRVIEFNRIDPLQALQDNYIPSFDLSRNTRYVQEHLSNGLYFFWGESQ
jgi:hypothetical protein